MGGYVHIQYTLFFKYNCDLHAVDTGVHIFALNSKRGMCVCISEIHHVHVRSRDLCSRFFLHQPIVCYDLSVNVHCVTQKHTVQQVWEGGAQWTLKIFHTKCI